MNKRNKEENACLVVQCENYGEKRLQCGGGPFWILGDAVVLENEVNTMNKNNLGGRIANLLKKSGLTQRELANKVGVTEVSMSRYVNGDRNPKRPFILLIAHALHTTSDYLLGTGDKSDIDSEYYQIHRYIDRRAQYMTNKQKTELVNALID